MSVRALCAGFAATALLASVSGSAVAQAIPSAPAVGQSARTTLVSGDFGASEKLSGLTVQFGHDASEAGPLGVKTADDYDGLLPTTKSALSPYESLTNGGGFIAAAIQLASNWQFHVSASTLGNEQRQAQSPLAASRALESGSLLPRQTNAGEAGVTWNFAPWGAIALDAGTASEHDSLLGGGGGGVRANVSGGGLLARLGLGGGWSTSLAYHQGTVRLSPQANFTVGQSLTDRTYGIAVAKHGLFSGRDTIALAVTRPGPIYNGGIDLGAPTGVDLTRSLIARNGQVGGGVPETDVELGYVTTFFDGALALQANAAYQMNVAGQSHTNAVTVVSRAKINF